MTCAVEHFLTLFSMQRLPLNLILCAVMIHMAIGCAWHHRHADHVCVSHIVDGASELGATSHCGCHHDHGSHAASESRRATASAATLVSERETSSRSDDSCCHDDECQFLVVRNFEFECDKPLLSVLSSVDLCFSLCTSDRVDSQALPRATLVDVKTAGVRPHLYYSVFLL